MPKDKTDVALMQAQIDNLNAQTNEIQARTALLQAQTAEVNRRIRPSERNEQ